jgi:hypothetical protein
MKLKILFFILVVALVALSILLYLTKSYPVLYAFRESGASEGEASWSILHPFRNRDSEIAAQAMLMNLKHGEYMQATATLKWTEDEKKEILKRETANPLVDWKLIDIQIKHNQVRLYYRGYRLNSPKDYSPIWVTVFWSNQGWDVISYEAWY